MLKKLKNSIFFKNSILYTLGTMMTPLIGFIMLPIYTSYLSPDEYAVMNIVQTLQGMLKLFLLLSLHSAVIRFFYDFINNPKKQSEYLSSIFSFVLIISTFTSVILLIFKDPLSNLLFENIPTNPFYFYLIALSWVTALYELPMALFRAQEKALTFITVNIIKALLVMVLSIYLIIGKGMGAESALISQILITFTIILFTYGMQLKKFKFFMDITFVKSSLLFSIPLLPHVASNWIISASDRVILEKFIDLAELGIYSLAVQVSMVLSMFYTSVNNALIPRYTGLRKEGNELEAQKLLKIFSIIVLVFGLLSIPIAMLGIRLISSESYYGAIMLMPALLIGHMIKGFYYRPVAKLFYTKKTGAIATSSSIAAIANIVINFIAIPYIGIYGAIISTVIAELLRYLFIYRASKIYG